MNRAQGGTSSLALPTALTESRGGAWDVGPIRLEPVIMLTLALGRSCTEALPLAEARRWRPDPVAFGEDSRGEQWLHSLGQVKGVPHV